jgi:hypothetical protein
MKSSITITTVLLPVLLFFSIMVSGGCDEDKAWETADSSTGQTIMMLVIVDLMKTFTVGGTVTGLTGTGLVLQNNGVDDLPISINGVFQFNTPLGRNATYDVHVSTQPTDPVQVCTPTNGTGTVVDSNITDITITCTP